MENIKKIKSKKLPKKNHQSIVIGKNNINISNYKEKSNKSFDIISYSKYNSNTTKKNTNIKNRNKELDNKSKFLTNKKLHNVINKTKNNCSLYNLNDIFNCRQSYPIRQNKNSKLIIYGRLSLKRILNKKPKDINLTNNKISYNNVLDKRASYRTKKNHSELKNRENDNNKKIETDKLNNNNSNAKMIIKNKKNKLRRTDIFNNKKAIYENLNIDTDITEKKDENEIKNKVIRHNTTIFTFEKNNILFDAIKKEKNSVSNNNNNINELLRFSNISNINNNELFNLNNRKASLEGYESRELFDEDQKLLEEMSNNDKKIKENKNEQISFTPCLNCDKLISLEEMDEHSNKCFSNNKKNDFIQRKSFNSYNNQINIIENKLKNITEYLIKQEKNGINNNNIIKELKIIVEKILAIKENNSSSIDNLNEINKNIVELMEKYINDANNYALLSRIKIILNEKIQLFSEKNNKNIGIEENNSKKLKENSTEENISEIETMEFYDLKKILDEKNLKTNNLEKMINDAKNKRLFLMEVLKVKYQKINENKNENLISPEMLWEEAVKKKIEMKNWSQFIFNELSNPNKYLKKIKKKL